MQTKIQFALIVLISLKIHSIFGSKALQMPKSDVDPLWYLKKFGYLQRAANQNNQNNQSSTNQLRKMSENLIMYPATASQMNTLIKNTDDELVQAIRKFQKFANLNVTGKLDNITIETMKLPRCGHPDILEPFTASRKRRYALQGSKWLKTQVKYKISKYPMFSRLSRVEIDDEINRAFQLWGSVSQLKFEQLKEVSDSFSVFSGSMSQLDAPDIEIKFETGYHGDSEPFDGPGYILGHAYFPQFGGSTHFDAEEIWTKRSAEGVNLYQVAVHEFGHALGLEHSDNYDAIMAPFFRGFSDHFELHQDDITAIQYLYGKNPRQTPQINPTDYVPKPNLGATIPVHSQTITENEPESTLPPNLCSDGRFDAITMMQDGYTYIFKGAYVYKIDTTFTMDPTFPRTIHSLFGRWDGIEWVSIPDDLDSALYVPETGKTYFFKDELYWRTTHYSLDYGYPKIISENFKGLNSHNGFFGSLDASFLWGGNSRVYFIKGNKYWRYDLNKMEVERGYPKSLGVWRGLPERITDALQWANGVTYFFSNERYYRFNDLAFKVEDAMPPYPRLNVDAWFGCRNRLGNLILSENVTKGEDVAAMGDREEEMANLKSSIEKQGEAKDELDLSDKQVANGSFNNNGSILLNRILKGGSGVEAKSGAWLPRASAFYYFCFNFLIFSFSFLIF